MCCFSMCCFSREITTAHLRSAFRDGEEKRGAKINVYSQISRRSQDQKQIVRIRCVCYDSSRAVQ